MEVNYGPGELVMYDTIVLGSDMGSLVAAVTLANHGKKTILLTDDAPQSYSESGYTFDIDPLPWTGYNRGNAFKQFLSHLGIPQEDPVENPPLQIIFWKHRIELCGKVEPDLKEMKREFPDEVSRILRFYDSITKSSSFVSGLIDKGLHLRPETVGDYMNLFLNMPLIALKQRAFAAHLRNMQQEPQLRKTLGAQIRLLSHLDPHGISPISHARTLSLSLNGLSRYRGGKHLLIERLKKKFEADGGVIEGRPISVLDIERVVKVTVQPQDAQGDAIPIIYGRNMILSTKHEQCTSLLEGNRELSPLRKRYDKIHPSLYPFTLHLGVHDRCIPEKMGAYVVFVSEETGPVEDGNTSFPETNDLFLETSEPGDTLRAPDGKRAISVTAFLKNSPLESPDGDLKTIAEGMLKNLAPFLPFLEEGLDFMNVERSIYLSRSCQRTVSHKYAVKGPLIGMSFLPIKTPMKNLFLTGDMLIPGLGFEGEIMSGINAARLAMGEN